ncbi:MAG: DUF177 domain-containing protein [Blastocatellia bacterium]|nr:DUF177 domain-containing protein [Blastocatellia bacterium]
MKIDLSTLSHEPLPFDLKVGPDEIEDLSAELELTDDVSVAGTIRRQGVQIEISGEVAAKANSSCTRCAEPFPLTITADFEVIYVEPEHFSSEKDKELTGVDLNVDIVTDSEIDMGQIAREQIILEIPEKLICREDCRGLCEKCVQNLNNGDCTCETAEIDPRWAGLKDLL